MGGDGGAVNIALDPFGIYRKWHVPHLRTEPEVWSRVSAAERIADDCNVVFMGSSRVVHGFGPGSAGEFLVKHPGVDAITFTGETRTGEAIMQNAAIGVRFWDVAGATSAVTAWWSPTVR